MSHQGIRNKLLILPLLANFNCSILYKGNGKIENGRTLYPTKDNTDQIKDTLSLILPVNKNDLTKTLFLNIKIKNPTSTNRAVEAFSERFEKKLKQEGCEKEKDILIVDVNHKSEGKVTKEFIKKKVGKIKQKLIDQKYKKKFSNIIVSVVYDGGMRTLAQNIIKDLTNDNLEAYEICFNPDEKSFDTDADVNKAIENYKNPRTRKIKILNEKLKQDDASDEDEKKKDKDNFAVQVGDSNEKMRMRDVANEFVEEFFTKS